MSCRSLACLAAVLCPDKKNRKENEYVENLVFVSCDPVISYAVLLERQLDLKRIGHSMAHTITILTTGILQVKWIKIWEECSSI